MSSAITLKNCHQKQAEELKSKQHVKKIIWRQVLYLALFHAIASYGIYLCLTTTSGKTIIYAFILWRITVSLGIQAIHRLWCHGAYKAKLPLRIFLCIFASALGQGSIFNWSRDHRVHHKNVDTDADPHNIKRGFFFAHIGWLMYKKEPAVIKAGQKLSMNDLLADPVVRFNKKYYLPLWVFFCLFLPTIIPVYFWSERWLDSFCVAGALKYVCQLQSSFCINSFAHMYGYRPFDKRIEPRDSIFAECVQPGEGSHNYHHVFPMDYTTKEHAMSFNSSRFFIEFMALIGQAYDLKMPSKKLVKARKQNTGDGSM